MTIQIVYAGCGLSGRSTSLTAVMLTTGSTLLRNRDEEYNFMYATGAQQYHVVATLSTFRAWLSYEDPTNPALDKRIVYEIDRLCICDGIIFVIDSRRRMQEHNLHAFEELKRDLASRKRVIDSKPIVFQINKRDLDDICSMEWIREHFSTQRCDYVESIATQGIGTMEAVDKLFGLMPDQE